MTDTLLDAVRRYVEAHADPAGLAQTPIPGLTTIRSTAPSGLVHAISRPLVCLVLQGSKRVAMGTETFAFDAGDSLLITADVPTVSRITRASVAAPYLSLVLDLDPAVIADLTVQMRAVPVADGAASRKPMPKGERGGGAARPGATSRCCTRRWCANCTTGSWPAATGRRSAGSAGRKVTPGAWRAPSRSFGPSSCGRCRSTASRPWPE